MTVKEKNNFDFNKMINHGPETPCQMKDAIVLKIQKDGINLWRPVLQAIEAKQLEWTHILYIINHYFLNKETEAYHLSGLGQIQGLNIKFLPYN